jgi:hypothetical protein
MYTLEDLGIPFEEGLLNEETVNSDIEQEFMRPQRMMNTGGMN